MISLNKNMERVGFIGGSGFYCFEDFQNIRSVELVTPFGKPSSDFVIGSHADKEFVFLPRHGKNHELNPSNINFRANIYGFKELGVTNLFSFSAVGSMKLKLKIGHILVPDQFIDITRSRITSFFDKNITVHCSMADPVCSQMLSFTAKLLLKLELDHHIRGTYLCIEGPHFSSRAESFLFKSWGVDVIGMTNATEAKLCKEAEICYCSLNFITDYDCWHSEEENASTTDILRVLRRNVQKANLIIRNIMADYLPDNGCKCRESLSDAIVTPLDDSIGIESDRYDLLLKKYLKQK